MIWKDIKGYEDFYMISEFGDVKSKDRRIKRTLKQGEVDIVLKGKILNPTNITKKNRYKSIRLSNGNKSSVFSIHRLVYVNFISDIDDGMVINHIDLNRNNNHFSNLEKVSQIENVNHYWCNYYDDKIIDNSIKICTKCNNYKNISEFYMKSKKDVSNYKTNNFRSACKKCMSNKKINKPL